MNSYTAPSPISITSIYDVVHYLQCTGKCMCILVSNCMCRQVNVANFWTTYLHQHWPSLLASTLQELFCGVNFYPRQPICVYVPPCQPNYECCCHMHAPSIPKYVNFTPPLWVIRCPPSAVHGAENWGVPIIKEQPLRYTYISPLLFTLIVLLILKGARGTYL